MKSQIFYFIIAGGLLASCSTDDDGDSGIFDRDKEKVINAADLPAEISDYISTHFIDYNITKAIEDKEYGTITYEVYLSDNIQLDFNSSSEITEIDAVNALPESVIPQPIWDYVTANYPDKFISDWELENTLQQVELNNSIELEFNLAGEFIRVDFD